jgi:hypothetical protein
MSKVYLSIPDPQPTLDSLSETVRALKQVVELLAGQRLGGAAAHVFVQSAAPTAIGVGDLWIDPSNSSVMRYWNGNLWTKITIA